MYFKGKFVYISEKIETKTEEQCEERF